MFLATNLWPKDNPKQMCCLQFQTIQDQSRVSVGHTNSGEIIIQEEMPIRRKRSSPTMEESKSKRQRCSQYV